ncbi:MAG: glycosyltransferase involved in cell wall biosynthesis [Rhodothermales bacterium]|jgi:glycosyltransferase involved in cell wall biosynthesis
MPEPDSPSGTPKPLRIAQIATASLSIDVLLADHIVALQQEGHHVVAMCGSDRDGRGGQSDGTVPKIVIPDLVREPSPLRDLKAVWQLARAIREGGYDVVHSHTPKAGLLVPLAARLVGGVTVVHTIHGLLFHDQVKGPKWAAMYGLERFTATLCDKLLSQSSEDIEVARRTKLCNPDKLVYLGNGIDSQHFASVLPALRAPKDPVVIGCVGRLVVEKGFLELFEAIVRLREVYEGQFRLLVVGPYEPSQSDGISPETLRALEADGLLEHVGWQSDMRAQYARMHMFVLPSHREGVPRACMEAAAAGLPIIASDIRGCREVVEHGVTGLLCPPKNSEKLAEALLELVSRPDACAQMGEAGRQLIQTQFDSSMVLNRLTRFYQELGDGPNHKR